MWKLRACLSGLLGGGHAASATILVAFAASYIFAGLGETARAQELAQNTPGTRDSRPSGSAASVPAVDTSDGGDPSADTQTVGARGESSASVLTSIAHAPTPIIVVTVIIGAMSFYLVALIVWMAIHYRTIMAIPPVLVRDVQNLLDQSKFNDAYQKLAEDSSFMGKVVATGVRKLPSGIPAATRAMELTNEDVTMEMEHRTTYLATVGTLGPMIGLVGTVYGMIMAFQVIAIEGSSPQASQLAAGISTALYATLEGIAISIPAIFFYAYFRNRIARLSLEVGLASEPLLDRFAPGVRMIGHVPPPAYAPASAPPAHPHPFALSATLAATTGNSPRPALPSSGGSDG
jgi:biopolymer transport protein ExbB